nr:alpha/beta hydrolase [Kofleriaceae bacterium]
TAQSLDAATLGVACSWTDAARIDDILPDAGISAQLAGWLLQRAQTPTTAGAVVTGRRAVPTVKATRRAVQLGEAGHLAAILTEPRVAPRTVCILVNAGLVPKFGPHRLYEQIAQGLAENGVATLRLDLAGIGDSVHEAVNYPLQQRVTRDVAAAVEWATAEFAPTDIVVGGLCSGSEDALRFAALDSRVTGAILIDGFGYPTDGWRWRQMTLRAARRSLRALGAYQPLTYERVVINGGSQQGQAVVRYRYMAQADARALLTPLVARRAHLHFLYTGGSGLVNHRRQMRDMFPEFAVDAIAVDYFGEIEHTQMLAADRATIVTAIVQRLRAATRSA